MNLRPRAAAIILNTQNELLVIRQKNPNTGFEWLTLPGGGMEPTESVIETIIREVQEECHLICEPYKLAYICESIDTEINTHHLGMFFLAHVSTFDTLEIGLDPEVETQYIRECLFLSEKEIKNHSLPIFPAVFKNQFWEDLRNGFKTHSIYQQGKMLSEK